MHGKALGAVPHLIHDIQMRTNLAQLGSMGVSAGFTSFRFSVLAPVLRCSRGGSARPDSVGAR